MATGKNTPAKRKPLSAYPSAAQPVVAVGRLSLGTARTFAFTRRHAQTWGDVATPVTGVVAGFLASGLGADPLGPLGPGLDVSALDFTSPWRLTAGATLGTAALLYQRSDYARACRERRAVQKAFATLGAGEPPSFLHPKGRPVRVELPIPTKAGSSVVMKVPEGLNDRIMQQLAPTLAPMLRGQVTIRPVPPPASALKRAKTTVVASARRVSGGSKGESKPRTAEQQMLAYGHMQIDIRRKEVLREGVPWKHLAEMRKPGFKGLSVWDGWHVGMDENGRDVIQHLVQRDKISGGERGSGKSTGLHVDIAALALDPTARIVLLDPSKFAEFRRWLPIAYKAAGTPDDCVRLLEEMYQDGLARLERMSEISEERRANGFDPTNVMKGEVTTWIVIDELQSLTNHADAGVRKHCQQRLYEIVTQLRKVGFGIIVSTLKPTGEVIPTNLRDNIIVRESFRCSNPEMSLAVLGDANLVRMGYGGHTLAKGGPRGISFLLADDHPVRKAIAFLSEDERDEVLDVALRLRGLLALPPPPAAREDVTLADLSFGGNTAGHPIAPPRGRESMTLAKPAAVPVQRSITPPPSSVEAAPTPAAAPVEVPADAADEPRLLRIARFTARHAEISGAMIGREFELDWDDLAGVMTRLEEAGVVDPAPASGSPMRTVLVTPEDLPAPAAEPAPEPDETPAPASGEAARHGYTKRRNRPRNRTHSTPAGATRNGD